MLVKILCDKYFWLLIEDERLSAEHRPINSSMVLDENINKNPVLFY